MADRAFRDDDPNKGVFDLENDERWQERLAEARKRREVALKKKAGLGHNQPKPKPWEIEESNNEPKIVVQPPSENDKQRDFSDRVDTMRKGAKSKNPAPERPISAEPKLKSKTSVDDFLPPAPDVPVVPRLDRQAKPISQPTSLLVPEDAPEIGALATKYAASLEPDDVHARSYLKPPSKNAPEPEVEAVEAQQAVTAELPRYRRGRPPLLIFCILALAAVPFFAKPPPLERGPTSGPSVYWGSQPALGITSPMILEPLIAAPVVLPAGFTRVPLGPMQVSLDKPADFLRTLTPMAPPSDSKLGFDGWSQLDQVRRASVVAPTAPEEAQISKIALDGAPLLSPKPRARPGAVASVKPAAPDNPLRVTILVPQGSDAALANAIGQDIAWRGHQLHEVKAVPAKVNNRNLRYFHPEDRGQAELLAAQYDATLRDFTSFRPSPKLGVVELWLDDTPLPSWVAQVIQNLARQ